jgi:hypothetical protein
MPEGASNHDRPIATHRDRRSKEPTQYHRPTAATAAPSTYTRSEEPRNRCRHLRRIQCGDIAFIMEHLAGDISWDEACAPPVPWLQRGVGTNQVVAFFTALGAERSSPCSSRCVDHGRR